MEIVELKKAIEENTLDGSFLVLQWSDNNFIAHQYVNEIAKNKHLKLDYIDSLEGYDGLLNDFFGEPILDTLYIMNIDTFKTTLEDFSKYNNIIVICSKVDGSQSLNDYIVKIPKLEGWQINDYMSMRCQGINKEKVDWLQKITSNNIYRIDNELSKISIFDKVYQNDIFDLLNNEGGYSDLSINTFYDFINALKDRDLRKLKDLMVDLDNIDVEPMGLVTVLHNDFKLIINIKLRKLDSDEAMKSFLSTQGLSEARFKYLKNYVVNRFSEKHLTKIFYFISTLDYKLKSGQLGELSNNRNKFIDYIVCNILNEGK